MEQINFLNVWEQRLAINQGALKDLLGHGALKDSIDEVKQRINRLTNVINHLGGPSVSGTRRSALFFVKGGY